MNLTPWAGAVARVSVVTGVESTYLWRRLMPMQGVGLIAGVVIAIIYGKREVRLGAGLKGDETLDLNASEKEAPWTGNISSTWR